MQKSEAASVHAAKQSPRLLEIHFDGKDAEPIGGATIRYHQGATGNQLWEGGHSDIAISHSAWEEY
jgi:hypothetical protein